MTVQKIKVKKTMEKKAQEASAKLKVAAYCRVSTDTAEQESSYEAQCAHYMQFIRNNPEWEFAGIYADDGISGTSTKHRDRFNQMIRDCEEGRIGMVITKSISRFARNTLDCLQYIRKLKALGIAVYFEKEAINTLDAKGEVLITIMASIAQQESQSISQNVRMGIQYRMQEGKGRLNTAMFMGYTRGADSDTLAIVPQEAATVRRIFREYLEGCSPAMIAGQLEADGIPTPAGKKVWYPSTITSMLENEKYAGDLLLQKYYTVDFLTHRIARNTGQLPQYYVENHHEPIVPRPVYKQVQGELMRRGALKNDPSKIRYGSSTALFGRLVCGRCGRVLKRYQKPDAEAADWRCRKRAYTKKSNTREVKSLCGCRFVPECEAKQIIIRAFNMLSEYRNRIRRMQEQLVFGEQNRMDALAGQSKKQEKQMEERKSRILSGDTKDAQGEIAFLNQQIDLLQKERNSLILERAEYANQAVHLRLLLELIDIMLQMKDNSAETEREAFSDACYDYEEFFRRTRYQIPAGILDSTGKMIAFDDGVVLRYLDKVIVCDDCYAVHFKGGISMRIAL